MEILFIRHAQSENNSKVPYGGSVSASSHPLRQPDPSITEIGQRQIARLADFLPGWWDLRADEEQHRLIAAPVSIQRLYCSAMRRALQSAAPLAAALDAPVQVRADIHEIGGIYDAREGGPRGCPARRGARSLPITPITNCRRPCARMVGGGARWKVSRKRRRGGARGGMATRVGG